MPVLTKPGQQPLVLLYISKITLCTELILQPTVVYGRDSCPITTICLHFVKLEFWVNF